MAPISYKTEIRRREAAKIRENGAEVSTVDAEPGGKCRKVLVDGRARNPAACVGIVRTVNRKSRKSSVSALAIDGAAHDEVMAAPAVITATVVAQQGAAKIAGGKSCYVAGQTQLLHRALEGEHALAQLGEQIGMGTNGGLARAESL